MERKEFAGSCCMGSLVPPKVSGPPVIQEILVVVAVRHFRLIRFFWPLFFLISIMRILMDVNKYVVLVFNVVAFLWVIVVLEPTAGLLVTQPFLFNGIRYPTASNNFSTCSRIASEFRLSWTLQ